MERAALDAAGGAAGAGTAPKTTFKPIRVHLVASLSGGRLPSPQLVDQTLAEGGCGIYATLDCQSTPLKHLLGVKATGKYKPLTDFLAVMRKAINAQKAEETANCRIPSTKRLRDGPRNRMLAQMVPPTMTVTIPAAEMRGGGDWEFRAILPGHAQHAPTMEATDENFQRFFVAAGGVEAGGAEQLQGAPMQDLRRGKSKTNLAQERAVRLAPRNGPRSSFTARVPLDTPAKKRKKTLIGLSPESSKRKRNRLRANVYSGTRISLEQPVTSILAYFSAKRDADVAKKAQLEEAKAALRKERKKDPGATEEDRADAIQGCEDDTSSPCTPARAARPASAASSPAASSFSSPRAS